MIDIYWASGSCNSWCVLLALQLKRIPHASKLIAFSKKEHKTPEYLALNPRGKVPCLVDGDYVLYESLAILTYLDRKYPDPPLYGGDPREAGTITRLCSEFRCYVEPGLDRLLIPIIRGKTEDRSELGAAAQPVQKELAVYEGLLDGHDYLWGDRLSAADLVVFPGIQQLRRQLAKKEVQALDLGFGRYEERYPRLSEWNRRIEAIPGYELTYPPHWK